ncbi:TetR family transcriptional regulator [Kribbella voronezhensis]|uniref:TetR family transcriptional regulator n=1 Tax=Kribbella voronezhensis TaxID=2512212 RepID=A0A4R7TGA7_9ACTN|nr:TetR family transcriptional regulator [Kribbella voronezhensis]TDU91234.1 TetR family transcriptional regulator [Kribbella voronezhensis]
MTFQRARSEEQRAVRRGTILATAEAMLTEMPVAQLSLNELSRRVGLAKSNVLNYFESREAVLLELVNTETQAWVQDLADALSTVDPATPAVDRGHQVTAAVVRTLEARPVFCDLISSQAAVLEHNISTEMALAFKRATVAQYQRMIEVVVGVLPELGVEGAGQFISTAALLAGAIWSHACAGPAILAAFEADPSLAALRIEFEPAMTQSLNALLTGLLPR